MFDGKYFEWNQKRIKGIVDFYGYKFFYFKRILDLGCGYGDLGGVLYRLGADITCVDARQEHLKVLSKKFQGIKTVKADLDGPWPFFGQRFELILDLGLICHLENYKKHLQEVCASTTHLVLETAVCDSDDPDLCIKVPEDRGIYDLSVNGMGCRPTAAAIEKVLRECGMSFKRMDNAKFNTDNYKYDWPPLNDKGINPGKRKIWFCIRESSPFKFASPESEIAFAHASEIITVNTPTAPFGFISPNQNNTPVPTTIVEIPPPKKIEAIAISHKNEHRIADSLTRSAPIMVPPETMSVNDKVRYDSREYSLITMDKFDVPFIAQNHDIKAAVTLNSLNSKMWFNKITSFIPKIQLSKTDPSMPGFPKWPDAPPNLIMCSLNTLQAGKRVWIDEWSGLKLTKEHIAILKDCATIVTPSLLNNQEILKYLPDANVVRMVRPWPILPTKPAEGNYYLYFEKSPILTKILFQAWDSSFGDLVVVGSSVKVPPFAKFISDCVSYEEISKLILGTKSIIDLSENNYYVSGLLKMATIHKIHIITNNTYDFTINKNLVQQNKKVSLYPTSDDVKQAIYKSTLSKHPIATYNVDYPNIVSTDIRRLLGI
jgi:SAM-dependent methyltransferase